jgi:membrane-associated phospholipid phosphatase
MPFQLAISRDEALKVYALWRDGAANIRFDEVLGLIGAPSFHTVMALLTVRSLWGVRWIGPISLIANGLVLLAVPADGGHHFIDAIAGAAVAVAAVLAARRLLRPCADREMSAFRAPLLQKQPLTQTN